MIFLFSIFSLLETQGHSFVIIYWGQQMESLSFCLEEDFSI